MRPTLPDIFARALLLALAVSASTPTSGSAQTSSLDAVALFPNESALGDMVGGGFTTMNPIGRGAASVQLTGFLVGGAHSGFGVPCGGFVRPGTCAPQPIRTTGRLGMLSVGLGWRLTRRESLQLHLAGGPAAGVAVTRTHGLVSGETRKGSEVVVGGTGGLDLFWWPGRASRFGVHLGASAIAVFLPRAGQCVDCDVPFDNSFEAGRLQLGVVFGRPVVGRASAP